jgi:hypothetical protein
MYELSWFLPSLFPIFGLALEGGESFKLGEVFREFPMYLCGGHIKKKSVNIPPRKEEEEKIMPIP